MISPKCAIAVFLCFSFAVVLTGASNNNSPLCRRPSDFIRDWGVRNDPHRFWRCKAFGVAELIECPAGREFSDRYSMCTVPNAIIGDIDVPSELIPCEAGQAVDLSGEPKCVPLPCEKGHVTYDEEGHPVCVKDPGQIQLCPGASEDKRVFGGMECGRPECTFDQYISGNFYPSADPTQFYRCAHESTPVLFSCGPGTCFDAQTMVCVWPGDWNNSCA